MTIAKRSLTVVVVSGQVLLVNEQIVIPVQFPEFTVNHVEVLVAKILRHLVNVLFVLEHLNHVEQVGPPHLRDRYSSRPGAVDAVEYASYDRVDISRVKFRRLFEERETGMGLDNILHEGYKIFGAQPGFPTPG